MTCVAPVRSLYVSVDLEGIGGICHAEQCYPTANSPRTVFDKAIALMAKETQTIVQQAFASGVERVLVNDAHSRMANLQAAQLDARVELLLGKPKIAAMMAGLDDSFDAAMLVGYHAKAGTQHAVLAHSFAPEITDIRLNGHSYGEIGLNILYAQLVHNVPVLMVTGDDKAKQELEALPFQVAQFSQTKTALSAHAAIHRPFGESYASLSAVTKQVCEASVPTCPVPTCPAFASNVPEGYTCEVEFALPVQADLAALQPSVHRVNGRTIAFKHSDFSWIYRTLQTSYTLLAAQAHL